MTFLATTRAYYRDGTVLDHLDGPRDAVMVEFKGRKLCGAPYIIIDLEKDVGWGSWSDREADMHRANGDPVFEGPLMTDPEWDEFRRRFIDG